MSENEPNPEPAIPECPEELSDEAKKEWLTRSLREWGFVQPVLVRRGDNTVIGGHQRLLAARRLGIKTVPVIFLDLKPEQARLLNVALNKISGEWDQELLARMLSDLRTSEEMLDLTLSGFDEDELDKLMKSLDVREKRERGVVRRGRGAGGRTCRHTRQTWRVVGDGRSPAACRRCDRRGRRVAAAR